MYKCCREVKKMVYSNRAIQLRTRVKKKEGIDKVRYVSCSNA